ncbi:hypothetical protein FRC08_011782 [Ceratobasidium sp. 394]|nr:hypothetical protein FRC08_011782 [Ceratobasidium sp. 394]
MGGTPVAAKTPKPSRTCHSRPKAWGHAPSDPASNHVHLIVWPPSSNMQALDASYAQSFAKGPSEPFCHLAHALSLSPSTKNVTLLGVHQNQHGNLVISLAPGTPD